MFRLLTTNAQQTLKPVLLLQVRTNKGISLPSTTNALQANANNSNSNANITPIFTRSNSHSTTNIQSNTNAKVDSFIRQASKDPLLRDSLEISPKYDYFQEQYQLACQYRNSQFKGDKKLFSQTFHTLVQLVDDKNLRLSFGSRDLFNFVGLLNYSIFNNRNSRLNKLNNRDSDQRNDNLKDEVFLKSAVLRFSEYIANGEFKSFLEPRSLSFLFFAMAQFNIYPEMISLWENGVNDDQVGKIYLNERILGIILPITYETKRFDYEEVLHIYELNTKTIRNVNHELLASMGKISISAGDYSRGLDCLEALLGTYESGRGQKYEGRVLSSLRDLHLSFIGSCKDMTISKHFFDKVVQYDLPYDVRLKVPHIQSLLENCYKLNEPFESILYFWTSTIKHYNNESQNLNLNSRYSILNNTFFAIFFKTFPQLNSESFNHLKQIIATYSEIKPVDEVFLNTIITNYNWNDKNIFQQLIENYSIYQVERTPVSYRVCLKKTGEIADFTNEEILEKWNQSLKHLDDSGFSYIPIADWASIRDATILSQYSDERKQFYLKLLNTYKNFIQDDVSCVRFLNFWNKKQDHYQDIIKLSLSDDTNQFNTNIDVTIPNFQNLKENIKFDQIAKKRLNSSY